MRDVNVLFPLAAKYREEFKLIIDRIAVVKSENVSKNFIYSSLLKEGELFSQLFQRVTLRYQTLLHSSFKCVIVRG